MTADKAIEIKNLTKAYGNTLAVNRVNLSIDNGELFALLGVNGAGKTTTIKMLSCLVAPTQGDALLLGKSIKTERNAVKATIGLSPQESAVAMALTVQENLELMCGIYGFDREKTKEKLRDITARFHLESQLLKKARTLSGGWQRRLSMAMAFIGEPKILFLDEPTLGLDVLARSDLWDTIRELKRHITIILTTHYMEEAEALADRIGIMKDGQLIALGTVQDLKESTGTDSLEKAFIALVKEVS